MRSKINETDVVVIGGGAAGLAAAVTAAESGAKVTLFEKRKFLGGSSNFFLGTFAVESDMQTERNITYGRDEAFKNIMDFSHWRANARLVRAVVDKSADTITWLQQHGIEFIDVVNNRPYNQRTYHTIKGAGVAVVKTLAVRAKEAGVDIQVSSPVKKLIKKGGRIIGVVIEEKGKEKEIKAKAVVIASGGYANNKEWIKKYSGFELGTEIIPFGNVDKTGDGIRMAWEMGADQDGLGPLEVARMGPLGGGKHGFVEQIACEPDLWVDCRGKRFCDETIGFQDTLGGNASARLREGYSYSLFDDSIIKLALKKTPDIVVQEFFKIRADQTPEERLTDVKKELKEALENNSTEILQADSIEGLAKKTGINTAVLKATVKEYNQFCSKGHDDLFAKDLKYLRPLNGPNFYAVKMHSVFIGTKGGIKINDKTEVVDRQDTAIPGLYATGFDAGGMYGDSYPITVASGLSSAYAIISGRIAGENAVKYLGK